MTIGKAVTMTISVPVLTEYKPSLLYSMLSSV